MEIRGIGVRLKKGKAVKIEFYFFPRMALPKKRGNFSVSSLLSFRIGRPGRLCGIALEIFVVKTGSSLGAGAPGDMPKTPPWMKRALPSRAICVVGAFVRALGDPLRFSRRILGPSTNETRRPIEMYPTQISRFDKCTQAASLVSS